MAERAKKPAASRKNRDQERLYRPGKLSVWMAVWSVLLLVAWVLLIRKDYARPWKDYQAEFYEAMIRVEDATSKQVATSAEANAAAVQELEQKLIALEQQEEAQGVPAKIDRLLAELDETVKDAKQADAIFKGIKGDHAVAKYHFEMARLQAYEAIRGTDDDRGLDRATNDDVEAKRAFLNDLSDQWFRRKREAENLQVQTQNLEAQIASLRAPKTALEKQIEQLNSSVTLQDTKLQGLKQKYARNQWRNAPFIDFISPTIKIRQVVLEDIHDDWNFATNRKVDRCTTCHVGIAMPDFGNPEIVGTVAEPKHGVEAYMRAHSHLDVIAGPTSPHKVEEFGCSICHHGIGWSTDFARAVHTPENVEERLAWIEKHDWYKAKYIEYPMLPLEYVQGQCFKCHKEGIYDEVPYVESLDHGYVHDHVTARDAQGNPREGIFAQRTITNDPNDPRFNDPDNRILEPGEAYGDYAMPSAPHPVDGSRVAVGEKTSAWASRRFAKIGGQSPISERDYSEWMAGHQRGQSWNADAYHLGYDSVVRYGCQGCHKIQDFGQQVGVPEPPKVGPDLTYLADKIQGEKWLKLWLQAPDSYREDTKMPSFFKWVPKNSNFDLTRDDEGRPLLVSVIDAHMFDPNPESAANMRNLLGAMSTPEDHARDNLEIVAIATYLMNLSDRKGRRFSRADKDDPNFNPVYLVEPPEGDVESGRKLVNRLGCAACHVLPEIETGENEFAPDSAARFDYDPLLMRGPRLNTLGSKPISRKWFNAWLLDPRGYTAHTNMPAMRIGDEVNPLTKAVLRTGEQRRADIIDYLLGFKDEKFEALDVPEFNSSYIPLVKDMWEEYRGKDAQGRQRDPNAVSGEMGDLNDPNRLATVLSFLGERSMSRRGCFGCHNVEGHLYDMPIGVELTKEGNKDIHQFDFGRVPKYVKAEVKNPVTGEMEKTKVGVIPHTRADFIRNKIMYPRVYDYARPLRWTDRLRMPRFNFRPDDELPRRHTDVAPPTRREAEEIAEVEGTDTDYELERMLAEYEAQSKKVQSTRAAVTGIVLGLLKQPIKPGALYQPDEYEADIIAGRRVVKRYGCANCHTIEGQAGYLWKYLADENGRKIDPARLPPNLFSQGWRTRDEWLTGFLHEPEFLRPLPLEYGVHMPKFGMNDAEILALVKYFKRLGGRDRGMGDRLMPRTLNLLEYEEPVALVCRQTKNELGSVTNGVEEAKRLFEHINCNKCHLPKGAPGLAEGDGGVAPSFEHSPARLRQQWVRMLLNDPQHLIVGTAMPKPYAMSRKGVRECSPLTHDFQFHLRYDPRWQEKYAKGEGNPKSKDPEFLEALAELARVQMDALAEYLAYYYEPPVIEPPVPGDD